LQRQKYRFHLSNSWKYFTK